MGNKNYYIKSLICVLLMLAGFFIQDTAGITHLGWVILFIFIGSLYGWIFVGMGWPSIVSLVLLGFTEFSGYSVTNAITSALSNGIIQQILWLFVFAAILTSSGLPETLVRRLLSSRFCKSSPWRLTFIIIIASYLCSMLGGPFTGIVICWEFVRTICEKAGLSKSHKWSAMAYCGVVFGTCVGGAVLPYSGSAASIFGYLSAASNGALTYNYLSYMVVALVFSLVILAFYFLFCYFVIKPDMSLFKDGLAFNSDSQNNALTTPQKISLWCLALMIVLMILPSLFPDTTLATTINNIGTLGAIFIIIAAVSIPMDREGHPYFTINLLCQNGIRWEMILMMASAVTVGNALINGETGIQSLVTDTMQPLLAGSSPYVYAFLCMIALLILTNLINNGVAGAIMVPMSYMFASSIGANAVAITALISVVTNIGILLPCSSAYGAMLSSKKECFEMRHMYINCAGFILATITALLVIGIPLSNALM